MLRSYAVMVVVCLVAGSIVPDLIGSIGELYGSSIDTAQIATVTRAALLAIAGISALCLYRGMKATRA